VAADQGSGNQDAIEVPGLAPNDVVSTPAFGLSGRRRKTKLILASVS
jgi:hypothetical protein